MIYRLLIIITLITTTLFAQTNQHVFRTPAPSPNGEDIAFSTYGDIWIVSAKGGIAKRITSNKGYDYLPVWSPDGKNLAFTSDRYGNRDVFTIPLDGGNVKRHTFFSNSDYISQWLDDDRLLFASRRLFYYSRMPLMYTVDLDGGTPTKLLDAFANQGVISPDGKYLAFLRGRADVFRKHYRGSSNTDIFLYEFDTDTFTQLTDFDGNDMFPMWSPDSKTIYFASESDGTMNLYKMDTDGNNKTQLTTFIDDGVRLPKISKDGSTIAFEVLFDLYVLQTESNESTKLTIAIPGDYSYNPVEYKKYTSGAADYALTTDGKQIAFEVHGELFSMNENGRFIRQITDSPWKDENPQWFPNKDSLLFVSDRTGKEQIYIATGLSEDSTLNQKISKPKISEFITNEKPVSDPLISPDGSMVTYIKGNGDLILLDLESGDETVVLEHWYEPSCVWSPDSKWLAYTKADIEMNLDIYLYNIESQKAYNISQHPDYDHSPRFSPDGKKIAFVSKRKGWSYDIWMAYLNEEDVFKTEEMWEEYFDEKNEKDSIITITNPEKLYTRFHRVTSIAGVNGTYDWSPDGQWILFRSSSGGKANLWKVKWNGSDLEQVTKSGDSPRNLTWHEKQKEAYYLDRSGKINKLNPSSGKASSVSFKAELKINHPEERKQLFTESWNTLNTRFYDPDFHGVDWNEMYKKYYDAAVSTTNTTDFNTVISMMLGELNASHLGISGPSEGDEVSTGLLGLRYEPNEDGNGFRITEIIPNGPCDLPDKSINVDDILISINGITISKKINMYQLLENTINDYVLIETMNSNTNNITTNVINPISYSTFADLEYDRWRNEKRDLVHALSDYKLGYIHIRAMGQESLDRFEMELYAEAHDKDALVIDVRNNGGGWTTDYLLNMLMIKDHAYTIPRDGSTGYPQTERRPLYAWTKPIIVLCNEWSFSNAEIFSHAIKTLNRGKLVGVPTGGLVISTGGITLLNGASFRMPWRGWYVLGSGMNMENNGAVPDIIIQELPEDAASNKDRQLEAAIEELLKDLHNK